MSTSPHRREYRREWMKQWRASHRPLAIDPIALQRATAYLAAHKGMSFNKLVNDALLAYLPPETP